MTQPEIFPLQEEALAQLLGARDPHILFADELDFIEPYRAGVHPDKFALHRWSSDDGTKVQQFTIRVTEGEDEANHLRNYRPESFVLGQSIPASPVFPAQPEMIYRGRVSKEEALADALAWLVENDDGRDHPNGDYDDMDEVVGFLNNGTGIVAVTGIGAAIFGNHIHAMQDRGAAYLPVRSELDS
jgi:hypothetical protein